MLSNRIGVVVTHIQPPTSSPFLTARWESLVFLNYACPESLLRPLVPAGTTLDDWNATFYVSLVAFMFADTRVRGIAVPMHKTFEEVNLRFYVRRHLRDGSTRRGVVFIKELVPRWGIAAIARGLYNEPYSAVSMTHTVDLAADDGGRAEYVWRHRGSHYSIAAEVTGPARSVGEGEEAAFITEHYWGYSRQRDGSTLEYQVTHPPWALWQAPTARFNGDGSRLYGRVFGEILDGQPISASVAMGSEVAVYSGRRLVDGGGTESD